MGNHTLKKYLFCGFILLIVALFPLVSNNFFIRFGTDILMFAIMASAWNIIGGYTGYASFGNVVFFGIGAYVTAVLMEKAAMHFTIAYLAAGGAAALFAVLIGLPVLRLRGHPAVLSILLHDACDPCFDACGNAFSA
ncbi:MAG: hypothetical protein P8X55_21665 [Desulfosarcinaceae bacterium]